MLNCFEVTVIFLHWINSHHCKGTSKMVAFYMTCSNHNACVLQKVFFFFFLGAMSVTACHHIFQNCKNSCPRACVDKLWSCFSDISLTSVFLWEHAEYLLTGTFWPASSGFCTAIDLSWNAKPIWSKHKTANMGLLTAVNSCAQKLASSWRIGNIQCVPVLKKTWVSRQETFLYFL